MSNIYKDFITWDRGSDITECLETFKPIFERVDLDLIDYEDELPEIYDEQSAYRSMKMVLLFRANDEGIIPADFDVWDDFEVEDDFAIIRGEHSSEEVSEIVDNFKDWCGLKLNII